MRIPFFDRRKQQRRAEREQREQLTREWQRQRATGIVTISGDLPEYDAPITVAMPVYKSTGPHPKACRDLADEWHSRSAIDAARRHGRSIIEDGYQVKLVSGADVLYPPHRIMKIEYREWIDPD